MNLNNKIFKSKNIDKYKRKVDVEQCCERFCKRLQELLKKYS